MFLCKISGTLTSPHRGSPYLRIWQGERPILSTTNGCEHGGKGDRIGVSSGRRQGRDTPFEPESSGGDGEEEDEDGEEGEVTPPPHSLLSEDLPSLGDVFNWQAGISVGAHRLK
jgi:hypothetical protein